MSALVRTLVSKKKRRFLEDGFDLDLTYITDRIIAMGYPAENMEGMYRNSMQDVVKFLDTRHPDQYKVYNLCSERAYDKSKFHGRVAHYPFEDHNAPPIELMRPFCEDVHQWLQQDPKNVVAIHCKAGKGRTGVMICAYLLYSKMWDRAQDALTFYGVARTMNRKGVTIPSQARYVGYFESLLQPGAAPYAPRTVFLSAIRLHTTPHFNKDGSCNPAFIVKMRNVKIYASNKVTPLARRGSASGELYATAEGTSTAVAAASTLSATTSSMVLPIAKPLPLCGDIKIELFHKQPLSKEKMCHFWFNTFFVDPSTNTLILSKLEVDKAHKDKQNKLFDKDFRVELSFVHVPEQQQLLSEERQATAILSTASTNADAPSANTTSLPSPILEKLLSPTSGTNNNSIGTFRHGNEPFRYPLPPMSTLASYSAFASPAQPIAGPASEGEEEEDSFENDIGEEETEEAPDGGNGTTSAVIV